MFFLESSETYAKSFFFHSSLVEEKKLQEFQKLARKNKFLFLKSAETYAKNSTNLEQKIRRKIQVPVTLN